MRNKLLSLLPLMLLTAACSDRAAKEAIVDEPDEPMVAGSDQQTMTTPYDPGDPVDPNDMTRNVNASGGDGGDAMPTNDPQSAADTPPGSAAETR